jgi:hypothetical protein
MESLKAKMMVAQNLKKQSTDSKMMTPAEMAEIVFNFNIEIITDGVRGGTKVRELWVKPFQEAIY